MNPNSDEAILQRLYGEDAMHRHIEDWRMKRSLDEAAYVDAGIQKWKRRWEPEFMDDRYDDPMYNDRKQAILFPRGK